MFCDITKGLFDIHVSVIAKGSYLYYVSCTVLC